MEPARARAKSKRWNSDRASVRIGGKPAAPCDARRNSARFRIRGRRIHRRERWGPGAGVTKAAAKEELSRRRQPAGGIEFIDQNGRGSGYGSRGKVKIVRGLDGMVRICKPK